jgi:hypothetical protein
VQTSRSQIWQRISEKFKCGAFKAALGDVRYLRGQWWYESCRKMSQKFLIPYFGSDCVCKWRNLPQTVCGFLSTRNIQLLALIELYSVALWSVNKISPESYDFAASISEYKTLSWVTMKYKVIPLKGCKKR